MQGDCIDFWIFLLMSAHHGRRQSNKNTITYEAVKETQWKLAGSTLGIYFITVGILLNYCCTRTGNIAGSLGIHREAAPKRLQPLYVS